MMCGISCWILGPGRDEASLRSPLDGWQDNNTKASPGAPRLAFVLYTSCCREPRHSRQIVISDRGAAGAVGATGATGAVGAAGATMRMKRREALGATGGVGGVGM
jgi:hypothetical protein